MGVIGMKAVVRKFFRTFVFSVLYSRKTPSFDLVFVYKISHRIRTSLSVIPFDAICCIEFPIATLEHCDGVSLIYMSDALKYHCVILMPFAML